MSELPARAQLRIVGINHVLEVRDGTAHVEVDDAKNLTLEQGAGAARELCDDMLRVLEMTNQFVRGLILDVRKAPSIAGPKTRAALGPTMAVWERAGLAFAVVVGAQPIKETQFTNLVREFAPTQGKVARGYEESEAWCLDMRRRATGRSGAR